jgi:hypothetical protein
MTLNVIVLVGANEHNGKYPSQMVMTVLEALATFAHSYFIVAKWKTSIVFSCS